MQKGEVTDFTDHADQKRETIRDHPRASVAENQNPCVALVIGVSDYTAGWPDLESMVRDVDAVPPAVFFGA